MKKLIFIISLVLLTACTKLEAKNTPINNVLSEIKTIAEFENTSTLDLKAIKNASTFGLNPNSISEGYAYYTNSTSPDLVLIARATNIDEVGNVEKSFSAVLNSQIIAWQDNKEQSDKIDKHLLKTIGDCVILAIGENTNEINQVFSQLKK